MRFGSFPGVWLALLVVVATTLSLPVQAHERGRDRDQPAPGIVGLGSLDFPTSAGSIEAQTAFERAALLLHLFEYDDAAKAFRKAQSLEPDFVMAVWGEAMTHN
ncbi:tetratricopeptide repeat protein, partial [Dokdonella sp.]|uniref:tetratricopeptide repeat protein n=1 Tax=Dokdonella sp. TaxID=2291710 RepID=UPI003C755A94